MIKAFFADFYGTIVHEDGEVIKKITKIISETGNGDDKSEIGSFWWKDFQKMFTDSYGEGFETQRVLEDRSIIFGKETPEGVESIKDLLEAVERLKEL